MTRGNQREVNRERATKRSQKGPGEGNSTLKQKEKNLSIICNVCKQAFMCTVNKTQLQQHVESKHPKLTFASCFPSYDS